MTLAKYTAKDITNFILNHDKQIQPNTSYHVWASDDGLHLTVNSWEYRDSEHNLITTIRFMDEVPLDANTFEDCVQFQMNNH